MPDKPIIFSGPMVLAIISGRKSMTRRTLCPFNEELEPPYVAPYEAGARAVWADGDGAVYGFTGARGAAVGDRLWVREAFRGHENYDSVTPREMSHWPVFYHADGEPNPDPEMGETGRVRSPIHMPRWASRLTLTVTDVRVQRLMEMTDADAVAEGVTVPAACEALDLCGGHDAGLCAVAAIGPRDLFESLWSSIHGPGAWNANPWVSAITFTTEQRNIDA